MTLPEQLLPMVNRPAPPTPTPIVTPAQVDQLLANVDELAAGGFLTAAQLSEVLTAITRAAEKRGIYPQPQPTGRDGLPH